VFDFAVASFAPVFAEHPFLFIYRETGNVRAFLEARTVALGIGHVCLAELEAITAGQAETVELGLTVSGIGQEVPITIFNIDTFRRPERPPFESPSNLAGGLEVFRGTGDNWSFVRPQHTTNCLVAETTEKIPISDLCSDGLYYFATIALFREALAAERAVPSAPELYIAPIYNHLIARGHVVEYREIPAQDIVFCGVPLEYEALSATEAPWTLSRGLAP
jgi:hypothetical protein